MRGASRVTCDGPECVAFIASENYIRRGVVEGWRTAPQETGCPVRHLCPKCAPKPGIGLQLERPLPGQWKCPRCGFFLMRTPFDMTSGRLRLPTKTEDPAEACPNDGTMLVQETEAVN